MSKTLWLIAIPWIVFASCSKSKRYDVPAEVDVYVQRFIEEGNARGADIKINRLVVEYSPELADEPGNVAGRCARGYRSWRKPLIELTTDFDQLSPEAQEQLIFHELGHCILDRSHQDRKLSNGHFGSNMNTHYWTYIAGQDHKRDYYLDEMFNKDTKQPSWSSSTAYYDDIDVANKTVVFQDNFDNNANGWQAPSGASLYLNGDGVMHLSSNCDLGAAVSTPVNIPTNADYEIEMKVKVIRDNVFPTSIAWNANEEFALFGYNKDGFTSAGTLSFLNDFVTANPCGIDLDGFNTITVRKHAGTMYYFVNRLLVDFQTAQNNDLNSAGIVTGNSSSIQVDHLIVYQIN